MQQDKLENALGYALAKSQRKFYQLLRKGLADYNLTPPQFGLLASLWERDGLSQGELGLILDVDRTTLTGIIDRLEKSGLVQREVDPLDRRSKLIYLTALGRQYEERVMPVAQEVNHFFSQKFSPEELEKFLVLLKKFEED